MSLKRIKCILIPTDYSPGGKAAVRTGVSLAKEIDAKVFIFHSYNLPLVGSVDGVVLLDDVQKEQDILMNKLIEELKNEYPGVSISGILEFGLAVDLIQHIVDENKIDLIVMGTKGETDSMNKIFGSVASHVVNHVNIPVLIIPKGHHHYNINEVLFATDFHFTNNIAEYLAPFIQLAKEFTPYVHIVQFKKGKEAGPHVENVEEKKLDNLLKDIGHSFHFIENGKVEDGLFEFSQKHHSDLIVIVTRHYSMWEKIFHQSLTKKVAMHSEIPVLVLHEG